MENEKKKEKKTAVKKNNAAGKRASTANKSQEVKETNKKKKVSQKEVVKEEVKEELDEVIVEKEEVIEEQEEGTTKKGLKKGDIALIVGLVVVLVVGFFVLKVEKAAPTYELPLALSGDAGLQELSYQEYQEKVDNDESFVVIISRETCSHCVSFLPVAEDFAQDNGVPMYYVDTDTFSDEDWDGFEDSNTFFKKKKGNWGTPTTIVLAGREAVDYIEGETTADELLELYEEYFEMTE